MRRPAPTITSASSKPTTRWTISEAHSAGASKPATSSAHWSWRRRCSRCGCRAAESRRDWPGSTPCSPTATRALENLALHVRARVLADKVVLDAWVNNYNSSDAEQALDDRARNRRSGVTGPSTHRLRQRSCLRRRGGSRDTSPRRSAWPERWGTSGGCPRFSASRPRPPWLPATPSRLRASAEEGREIANAIGDRFGSRQCGWRLATAYIVQGDLTGGIEQLREVVAEAEADHDGISRVTALLILPQALAYQGDASAARAAAEGAIESAAELGECLHRCCLHRGDVRAPRRG